jgi:hypothetical protein
MQDQSNQSNQIVIAFPEQLGSSKDELLNRKSLHQAIVESGNRIARAKKIELEADRVRAEKTFNRWDARRIRIEELVTDIVFNGRIPTRVEYQQLLVELPPLINGFDEYRAYYEEFWHEHNVQGSAYHSRNYFISNGIKGLKDKFDKIGRKLYSDLIY